MGVDGCADNFGALILNPIPASSVEAGDSMEVCEDDCVNLTEIGASFAANGSGATEAEWTSSGMGTFFDDATFANARFYCPDSFDILAGTVTLYLSVLDDPCLGPDVVRDSVIITIISGAPRIDSSSLSADTIVCIDPMVDDPAANDPYPPAILTANCGDTIVSEIDGYHFVPLDCEDGISKLIIRKHKFTYKDEMFFINDTISVAALDFSLFTCPPVKDTVYCNDTFELNAWGYPIPEEIGVPMIDTIPLWPNPPKTCDIVINYYDKHFEGQCPEVFRRDWTIKNTCSGEDTVCTQWIMIIDTLPPVIEKCIDEFENHVADTIYVPTNTHDCYAHTYIPRVKAYDLCSGIKQVKAIIEGSATLALEYNEEDEKWESHQTVRIHHEDDPIPVIYVAVDSCHLEYPGYLLHQGQGLYSSSINM